jgi:Holliday junction resolvase
MPIANEVSKLPPQSEHETQSRIINLIKERGGVVTRINSGSMIAKSKDDRCYRVNLADKGTSDIIALYCGVYLAIEVKYGDNKATKEQVAFLESVAAAGGVGLVAFDCEFVEKVLINIDYAGLEAIKDTSSALSNLYAPNRIFVRGEE